MEYIVLSYLRGQRTGVLSRFYPKRCIPCIFRSTDRRLTNCQSESRGWRLPPLPMIKRRANHWHWPPSQRVPRYGRPRRQRGSPTRLNTTSPPPPPSQRFINFLAATVNHHGLLHLAIHTTLNDLPTHQCFALWNKGVATALRHTTAFWLLLGVKACGTCPLTLAEHNYFDLKPF